MKSKILIALLFVASSAYAQSPMAEHLKDSPLGKIPVGEVEGVLIKGGKPLADSPVIIQVQQSGETVLTLPKKTDAQGKFVFKNIFRDPQFSYAIFAEHEGKIYKNPPFQMTKERLNIRFELNEKTEAGEMPHESESMPVASMPSEKQAGQWSWYQGATLFLSGIVVGMFATALFLRRKGSV